MVSTEEWVSFLKACSEPSLPPFRTGHQGHSGQKGSSAEDEDGEVPLAGEWDLVTPFVGSTLVPARTPEAINWPVT